MSQGYAVHFGRRGKKIVLQMMPIEVYEQRLEVDSPEGPGTSSMFPIDERTVGMEMDPLEFDTWIRRVTQWWEQMMVEKLWEKEPDEPEHGA